MVLIEYFEVLSLCTATAGRDAGRILQVCVTLAKEQPTRIIALGPGLLKNNTEI